MDRIPMWTRKKNSLEDVRRFLDYLGNPDRDRPAIHVAGTNGKGSVCAFLTSILEEAGYSTGTFISPHLVEVRERFLINGRMVDQESFEGAFETVLEASRKLADQGLCHPTFFEFLFYMAMVLFRMRDVDVMILETGMGGRLDTIEQQLESRLAALEEQVGGNLGTIEQQLESRLGALEKQVGGNLGGHLEEQLGGLEQQLGDRLGTLEQQLDDRLGGLEQQLGNRFGTLEQQMSDQLGSMNQQVGDRLSGLDRQVGETLGKLERQADTPKDTDDDKLTEKFTTLEENVHKECVKVYRNVQAVVVEENSKQSDAMTETLSAVGKMKGKTGAILSISIVALLASLGGVLLQLMQIMGIF